MPSAADETGFAWSRNKTLVLGVLCLAQFLESIDLTVVNLALPKIKGDLGFSEADLPWVINSYSLAFGGFMLLGGRVGDLLGRHRVFLWGVAVFTAASLASGLAQTGGMLIASRAVQGLAAGFVGPLTLAMIASSFPEEKARRKAVGIWGGLGAVSGAVGLVVGGALTGGPGWRWVFLLNMPVGLLILAGWRLLSREPDYRRRGRFDAVGAVTVTAAVTLFSYAVAQTSSVAWSSPKTIGFIVAAVALLAYFLVHEAVFAREPLVPLALFKNRWVSSSNILMALSNAGLYLTSLLLPLYMQQVMGYSPLRAGVATLPMALSLPAFAGVGNLLVARIGSRATMTIGMLVCAAGTFFFSRMSPGGAYPGNVLLPSLLVGAGAALMILPLITSAERGVPASEHGVAAGLINVSRLLGGALGIAVISTIATSRESHLIAGGEAVRSALSEGLRLGFLVSAGVLVFTALTAVVLAPGKGRSPERAEAAAQPRPAESVPGQG
jgi:EmrB/QacA subfamily drug resistance transporter